MCDNTKRIKKSLNAFLDSEEMQVAAINGEWGIGKTYFWQNEYVSKYKNVDDNKFIYVSLFGINSIDELKNALLSNFPTNEILQTVSTKGLFGMKFIGNFTPLLLTFAFNKRVKDKIICLDDIERKGDQLKIKDVFGLIDILSNQKKCKVILIHNKSQLSKEEENSYVKFNEKVVDIEIKYSPSYSTLSKIGFKGNNKAKLKSITEHINNTELRNIRVIKKVKRLQDDFNSKLKESEKNINLEGLKENLLKLFILLCGSYYKANKYEEYKKLKSELKKDFSDINSDTDINELAKESYKFELELGDLKLIPPKIIDSIDYYLGNGYFPDDMLSKSIPTLLSNYANDSAMRKYQDIYKKYYYVFEKNEPEFKKEMLSLLKSDYHKLDFRTFSSALDILGYLKCESSELINNFIIRFKKEILSWNLDEQLINWNFKVNEQLFSEIKITINKNKASLDIETVLMNILKNGIHNKEELNFLLNLNDDHIYTWIQESISENLIGMIRGVLLKFNANNMPEKQIAINTITALEKIAFEDKFNKKKIETLFGIAKT